MPDVFDEMTKKEIVTWARERVWPKMWPSRADMLFSRWARKEQSLAERRAALVKQGDHIQKTAVQRDKLSAEFNRATSGIEKVRIAEKLESFNRKIEAWVDESQKIEQAEKRLEQLYQEYCRAHSASRSTKTVPKIDNEGENND